HHDVESLPGKVRKATGPEIALRRKLIAQRLGLGYRAILNVEHLGLLLEEWQEGTPGRAARTQQQHAAAADRVAQVALDVSDEGEAVEVLGHDAVALELHAIDRAGAASALRLLGRVGKRVELERLRD